MISKDIQKLYESILAFAAMSADSEGYISAGVGVGNTVPALVGKKDEPRLRMILPTQKNLRSDQSGKIVFHPLAESAINDMLPVTDCLRKNINIKVNYVIGHIVQSLISLASSPDLHHKLTPEQLEMVVMLKSIDDTTAANLINILMKGISSSDTERLFVNVFVRRGGTYKGERYARVGVTTFNMYNDILKDPDELFGVKLRTKDRTAIKAMFEFIFPGIKQPEQYNFGSNDKVAPWLHALMKTSALVAGRLNDILVEYKEYIDAAEELMFDSGWVNAFDDLEQLELDIKRIPTQAKPAFTGTVVPEPTQVKPGYQISSSTVPQTQPYQQPSYQTQPYAPYTPPQPQLMYDEKGRLDFRSVMATNANIAQAANQFNMGNVNYGRPAMPRPYSGSMGNNQVNQFAPRGYQGGGMSQPMGGFNTRI